MAQERLDVNSGEDYAVPQGETQEYYGADIDGTLNVDGTLRLVDNPESDTYGDDGGETGTPEPFDVSSSPIELPINPLNLTGMQMGTAMFLVGFQALLLGAAGFFRNYAAGILLGLAFLALIFSGVFGIGLELFWVLIIVTILALIAGLIARWATS